MKDRLAFIISHLLDPTITFPFLLAIMIFKSGLSLAQIKILLPSLFVIDLVIPGAYFVFALRQHWVSDWEMSKREERLAPYGITLVCWLIGLILVHRWGNDFLLNLGLTFYLVALSGSVITVFWKISVHTAATTSVALVLNFLFNWQFPWLYVVIPVVAWARWQRQKHTISQLMGGFLLSLVVVLSSFRLFGYI